MEGKATPCECPLAGFCERHGVHKSAHLHKLCQSHIGYFVMWEDCQGPNQNPQDCIRSSTTNNELESSSTMQNALQAPEKEQSSKPKQKLPSTMEMARNFLGAATDHIKNGMKSVDENEQKRRLDICDTCPHIVEDKSRCGKCGCFLQTKTKWASSTCPIGKW